MSVVKEVKERIVAKHGANPNDCGRTEVQVALLTERINDLTGHFARQKKDFHSRMGLMRMVGKRKKLLNYLMGKDIERYRKLITELNIRK